MSRFVDETPQSPRSDRLAMIDMGSNSVRLVVFDLGSRARYLLFNEKKFCGLGEDLSKTGRLSADGRALTLETLARFMWIAERMEAQTIEIVGTAAMRDAADSAEFAAEILARTGHRARIAGGAEEARLAAQGVLFGDPRADGVTADLGGASLDLALVAAGGVSDAISTSLGPLRLQKRTARGRKRVEAAIDAEIDAALERHPALRTPERLHILGGSWRALVKAHMARENYPLRLLNGFTLDREAALAMADWGAKLSIDDLRELTQVSERRARVTPIGARVLSRLLQRLRPQRLTLSAYGLREGVLWNHLPDAARRRDPLIEAARELEAEHGRRAGFGEEIWRLLAPALIELEPGEARLAQAACILFDSSFAAAPDYRAATNFEIVTRNVFGAMSHEDRMFMAATLMQSVKGGRAAARAQAELDLLPAERRGRAEALGRGIRMAEDIAGPAIGGLEGCSLDRGSDRMTLTLGAPEQGSETIERALQAFADALGLSRSRVV